MKYKPVRVTRDSAITSGYAIDSNDFDSMCLRLVWQLSTAQIETKLAEARKLMYADACEKLTKEMSR